MTTLRLAVVLVCLGFTVGAAADMRAADAALARGDYETARGELQGLADQGDAAAQYRLACMYRDGDGVAVDLERAVQLFRLAADQGHADAQYALGQMHLTGRGVFKDDVWAISWFRKAAQQGHEAARRDLDAIYVKNGLEPPDWDAADAEAAAQPAAPGAPEQWQALETPETKPSQEDDEAKALALAREHGIGVSYEAEGQVEAAAAETSEPPPSHTVIAGEEIYARERERQRAAEQEAAAEQPTAAPAPAQPAEKKGVFGFLGGLFGSGESQSSPQPGAAAAPETGADAGSAAPQMETTPTQPAADPAAQWAQARSALDAEDYAAAVPALTGLAQGGDAEAQARLGTLYQTGSGVAQDPVEAARWYQLAAEQGDAQAQFNLANMYLLGEGVAADDGQAMMWYRKAAEQGHESAQRNLESMQKAMAMTAETEAAAETSVAAATPTPTKQSAPAQADALQDAEAAFARGDYAAAFDGFKEQAEAGNAQAQYRLAGLYEKGYGVQADQEWAITWYREAAVRGHRKAAERLDSIYAEAGVEPPPLRSFMEAEEQAGTLVVADAEGPAAAAETPSAEATPMIGSEAPESEAGEEPALEKLEPIPEEELAVAQWQEPETADAGPASAVAADTQAEAMPEEEPGGVSAAPAQAGERAQPQPAAAASEDEKPGMLAGFFGRFFGKRTAAGTAAATGAATAQGAELAVAETQTGTELTAALSDTATGASGGGAEDVAAEAARAPEIRDLAAAKAALAAGKLEKAAGIFLELAEAGDSEAQAHIGYMYYVGEGVRRDPFEAVHWYLQAAEQGNVDAEYNLAVAYAFGDGVVQDDAEAARWYRRAAEQGHAVAQYSLALSYALGEGVPQSAENAARWYKESAANGYAAAQYNLAYMYRTGEGVPQDNAEALKWYRAAAEQGHAAAQYNLGYMYRTGKGAERDTDEAIKWYRMAAAQGYAEARADLESLVGSNARSP